MSARAAFRYLILAWALARVRTSAAFSARSWAGEELGIFGESSSGGRSAWSSECSVPTNGGWFRLRGSDRNDEGRPRRVSGGAGLSPRMPRHALSPGMTGSVHHLMREDRLPVPVFPHDVPAASHDVPDSWCDVVPNLVQFRPH